MSNYEALPVMAKAQFSLDGCTVPIHEGIGEVAFVRGDPQAMDALFSDMSRWLKGDSAQAEAEEVYNEMVVLRTAHAGVHLVLAFDMGGSDICGSQLTERAAHQGLPERNIRFAVSKGFQELTEFCQLH